MNVFIRKISVVILLLLLTNCKNKNVNNKVIQEKPVVKKTQTIRPKSKVGANTYDKVIERTTSFADNLNFDLDYIREKGLPDKKFLAEFLGLYLKLDKAAKSDIKKNKIRERLKPFYEKTLKPAFHNMASVDDRLFKKNSMSYMRILWLLQQMKFDTKFYESELKKVQKRMDDHMKIRGEWQRAVFDKYYDYFKIKKPIILREAKRLKGPITTRQPISFYNRSKAYNITHFLFAAFDYGNKKTQTRFTKKDISYLKEILPQIIQKFEQKFNDDIVAELLTCQVLIGDTKTPAFKKSFNRLIRRQNNDGSFGAYERGRQKVGSDVEFRQYMHTTLVALETFVEFEDRK
ncbi:MAG: hypothetical protein V3U80_07240 [Flavobacteriaceae bacterium]